MAALSGRGGAELAEIPSPEELDALKAAAAKVQGATLRRGSSLSLSFVCPRAPTKRFPAQRWEFPPSASFGDL